MGNVCSCVTQKLATVQCRTQLVLNSRGKQQFAHTAGSWDSGVNLSVKQEQGMLLFVWDREFEIAEFEIADSKWLRKVGQIQGKWVWVRDSRVQLYHIYLCIIHTFFYKNNHQNHSVLYTDSIVYQAGPNLHTLKRQQRKKQKPSSNWSLLARVK